MAEAIASFKWKSKEMKCGDVMLSNFKNHSIPHMKVTICLFITMQFEIAELVDDVFRVWLLDYDCGYDDNDNDYNVLFAGSSYAMTISYVS